MSVVNKVHKSSCDPPVVSSLKFSAAFSTHPLTWFQVDVAALQPVSKSFSVSRFCFTGSFSFFCVYS